MLADSQLGVPLHPSAVRIDLRGCLERRRFRLPPDAMLCHGVDGNVHRGLPEVRESHLRWSIFDLGLVYDLWSARTLLLDQQRSSPKRRSYKET